MKKSQKQKPLRRQQGVKRSNNKTTPKIRGTDRNPPSTVVPAAGKRPCNGRRDSNPANRAAELSDSHPKVRAATQDPVFKNHGDPFVVAETKGVSLNQRAIAVKCMEDYSIQYVTSRKRYVQYDCSTGLWNELDEINLRRLILDGLDRLGEEFSQQNVVQNTKCATLRSISEMIQTCSGGSQELPAPGLIHAANGVLDLRGKEVKLLNHSPERLFFNSSYVHYDPAAKAPKFCKQLLKAALDPDDIELVRKYFGSILIGRNTCHGILLIRGTPGGGKSTLVSVLEKIIGEHLVAELQTGKLDGRFETSAFIGKSVLMGKDVPGNTLSERSAHKLKSLVGDDLLNAEIKYDVSKQTIRGDFHVVIVSNNNLRVALDGDEEAWCRRLLIVDFAKPKPSNTEPNFAGKLVAEEGPGILNWLIEGAFEYRDELKQNGRIKLSERQKERVKILIADSDNVRVFLQDRIKCAAQGNVSSEELLVDYHRYCEQRGFTAVGERAFQKQMTDLMPKQFRATKRNDLLRNGSVVRGYRGVQLATAAGVSDGSDAS